MSDTPCLSRVDHDVSSQDNEKIKSRHRREEQSVGEELFIIEDFGNYKLFLPPPGFAGEARLGALRDRIAGNQAWALAQPVKMSKTPITGSFIYAHPPNYHGLNTLEYTEKDWHRELSRLKDFGMDTVVFQAALWNELQECYYPSREFSGFRVWNVIEPMLDAANALKMKVFLGGYGSVTCWMDKLSAGIIEGEIKRQMACFRELMKYRDRIHGFYFTPESTYPGKRDFAREEFISRLYGGLFASLRSDAPELLIMMSPATFYYPGRMGEMVTAWNAMFADGAPDILAPQDSIGCGCITMEYQHEAYRAWRDICDVNRIELWANIEIFDCCPGSPAMRRPAPAERVRAQIDNASGFVRKMITWEALFYTSPAAGLAGDKLRNEIFTTNR